MTSKLKNIWKQIYQIMSEIKKWEPWNDFSEDISFVYNLSDSDEKVYFTLYGNKSDVKGIGCYFDMHEYVTASALRRFSDVNEPDLIFQNAIFGIWDDCENVLPENKEIIKELGLKFRGKGNWLQFMCCELQLSPRSLNSKEAVKLENAIGNFYMMMKAYYEGGLAIDLRKKGEIERYYNKKNNLWETIWKTPGTDYGNLIPQLVLHPSEVLSVLKTRHTSNYIMEVGEFILPPYQVMKDKKERLYFPKGIALADSEKGTILDVGETDIDADDDDFLLGIIENTIIENGKPKKIHVSNPLLEGRLNDFCDKIGVKIDCKPGYCKVIHTLLDEAFEKSNGDEDEFFDILFNSKYQQEVKPKKPLKIPTSQSGKSFVISVSLCKGCYRHIKIAKSETLETLHTAIIDAFSFDDNHLHAFFLDNKAWSIIDAYFSRFFEKDSVSYTSEYRLCDVLNVGQKFLYLFDFGNEKWLSCKVLRETEEICPKPQVIREVGETPFTET